jgi:hypothetical protein
MDAPARALGMSSHGGQTIASHVKSEGISADTVKSAITDALTKADQNKTADRAQQLAQRFLDAPKNAAVAPETGDVDNDGDCR